MEDLELIQLVSDLRIAVSQRHRFTTDSVLLAGFSAPKGKEAAAELCCGCGAALLLWFAGPQPAPRRAVGVDIDPAAVALLEHSIAQNGLSARARALCADLRRPIPDEAPGSFDLVACNPPYFSLGKNIGADAAARHETAVSIREVCRAAARLLRFGGRFCVCYRPARLVDLFCAMRAAAIEPKRMLPVAQRPGETPQLALVEGRLGGGVQLKLLAPAALENPDGTPSDFYRQMYRMR